VEKAWTWKRWIAANVLITIAAFLLSVWIGGGIRPDRVPGSLFASFLYTISIGSLCTAAANRLTPYVIRWKGPAQVIAWFLALLPAVGIGTLAAYSILVAIGIQRSRNFWTGFRFSLEFAALITVTFGAMMLIYEYWRAKYLRAELEKERALKAATEARLASLESRIHPHFLFNTLNSISSLIHSDPDRADEPKSGSWPPASWPEVMDTERDERNRATENGSPVG